AMSRRFAGYPGRRLRIRPWVHELGLSVEAHWKLLGAPAESFRDRRRDPRGGPLGYAMLGPGASGTGRNPPGDTRGPRRCAPGHTAGRSRTAGDSAGNYASEAASPRPRGSGDRVAVFAVRGFLLPRNARASA